MTTRSLLDQPRRWAVANLVGQIAIIGTGGAVRLTGSGLGCSTWPQCEPGSFTPVLHEATSYHPIVEFGNRTVTGLLLILTLGLALAMRREPGRSRGYRLLGWLPLGLVLTQAGVGGLSVLADLHPGVVGSHMLLSLALVAVSTLVVVRTRERTDGPFRWVEARPLVAAGWVLAGLGVVVGGLGVLTTGSGPHSGDDEVGYRFALDPAGMAKTHAGAVWVFLAVLAIVVVLGRRAGEPVRQAIRILTGLTIGQAALGYLQYLTGLPPALVAAHMVMAGLFVAATTNLVLAMRIRQPLPEQVSSEMATAA